MTLMSEHLGAESVVIPTPVESRDDKMLKEEQYDEAIDSAREALTQIEIAHKSERC